MKNESKKSGFHLAGRVLLCVFLVGSFLYMYLYHGYDGPHRDLYSVAVNNIFGIRGYASNGEVIYDPQIHIIETDDYGRTLFFYSEYLSNYMSGEIDYGTAFVIMQSSDDDYSYYYRDHCYMPYFDLTADWETISAKLPPDYFDALKEANDWNQELNEARWAKVEISKRKPENRLHPDDAFFDRIIYPYMVKNGYTGKDRSIAMYAICSETDIYGKELFYVYGTTGDPTKSGATMYGAYDFAIILNADGTFTENGIVEIPTPEDSTAAIRKLKLDTHWNVSD